MQLKTVMEKVNTWHTWTLLCFIFLVLLTSVAGDLSTTPRKPWQHTCKYVHQVGKWAEPSKVNVELDTVLETNVLQVWRLNQQCQSWQMKCQKWTNEGSPRVGCKECVHWWYEKVSCQPLQQSEMLGQAEARNWFSAFSRQRANSSQFVEFF